MSVMGDLWVFACGRKTDTYAGRGMQPSYQDSLRIASSISTTERWRINSLARAFLAERVVVEATGNPFDA